MDAPEQVGIDIQRSLDPKTKEKKKVNLGFSGQTPKKTQTYYKDGAPKDVPIASPNRLDQFLPPPPALNFNSKYPSPQMQKSGEASSPSSPPLPPRNLSRPKTSRGKARPSPDEFVDYVVSPEPSPQAVGETQALNLQAHLTSQRDDQGSSPSSFGYGFGRTSGEDPQVRRNLSLFHPDKLYNDEDSNSSSSAEDPVQSRAYYESPNESSEESSAEEDDNEDGDDFFYDESANPFMSTDYRKYDYSYADVLEQMQSSDTSRASGSTSNASRVSVGSDTNSNSNVSSSVFDSMDVGGPNDDEEDDDDAYDGMYGEYGDEGDEDGDEAYESEHSEELSDLAFAFFGISMML